MDQAMLVQIIIAVAIVIIVTLALLFKKTLSGSTSSRGNIILLTGEMFSGKTALYYHLKTGKFLETLSSSKPNEETFKLQGFTKPLPSSIQTSHIYDLPGHGTFKSKLPKLLPQIRTIFFLIDANTMLWKEAAQSLYVYLTNSHIITAQIPIVMVITKTDVHGHLPPDTVKARLLEQLEIIRKANANIKELESIGEENHVMTTIPLTTNNETFSFEKAHMPLHWIEISTKNNTGLDNLVQYF